MHVKKPPTAVVSAGGRRTACWIRVGSRSSTVIVLASTIQSPPGGPTRSVPKVWRLSGPWPLLRGGAQRKDRDHGRATMTTNRVWRRWFWWATAGEVVAFALPAATGRDHRSGPVPPAGRGGS